MTLLLRLTGELLLSAVVWLGLLGAIAAAVAVAFHSTIAKGPGWRRYLIAAVAGAAIAVAGAHRLGIPDPVTVTVWRRELLVLWAVAGSLVGSAVVAFRQRRPSDSSVIAEPRGVPGS